MVLIILLFHLSLCQVNELMRHDQSAIIGQLTYQENHLVHVYISNIEIQITPIQNSLFNSRHDYRIIYSLNNTAYYYDQIKNKYSWKNLSVRTIIGNSLRGYKQYNCTAELQLVFRSDVPNLVVMTTFDPVCPMTQDRIKLFTYSDEALKVQTISFAILTSIVSLIQIFNAIKLIKMQPDENSLNSNTLSFILIQDVVMCLFSALLFDLYSSWMYILMPSIIFQLIVIILDLQINLLSQQETELNSHRIFKGGAIAFIQLLIITYLLYHIRKSTSLIILNLFLVPQIIETYIKGRRRIFNKTYVFGFLMPRIVIAIYLRGSTLNWLQLKVKYHVVFAIIIVVFIQIAIYYFQCRYGYFLRKMRGHNYFAHASITTVNCAICLNAISEQQQSQIEESDPHIKSALEEAQEMNLIMITPCVLFLQCVESLISPYLFEYLDVDKFNMPALQIITSLNNMITHFLSLYKIYFYYEINIIWKKMKYKIISQQEELTSWLQNMMKYRKNTYSLTMIQDSQQKERKSMIFQQFSDKVLLKIVKNIERNKNLNPFYDSWKKSVGKLFLYLSFIVVFFILFYIQIGLFIFFLGDPVIQFMYIYFIMYQFWWRGGRVSIGLVLEYGKTRPMEKYLRQQNRNYFGQRGLFWSLGGGGLWIQVDQNEI